MARDNDFITEVRALDKQLWDAVHGLKQKQAEYTAKDYGNSLDDGTGANVGYNKVAIGSVVFDTTDAILALFAQGHGTNVANLL
jgi:hypothetical protein